MTATIISILHTQTPAEIDILSAVSQHLVNTLSQDNSPTCITFIHDDFDTTSLPELTQIENPIVLLTGSDSITTAETLHKKYDCEKCLIWIASSSLTEGQYKTIFAHVDIVLKPQCVADSDLYHNSRKALTLNELPHNINTATLIKQMQGAYFQDTISHTQTMGKPTKTCWNLFFRAEKPTPIVALLGGSSLMHNVFNKEVAQDLANHLISKWKGKRFYVIVIADHFTTQESRDAFTLILELNKTPYVVYDDKRLLAALAYVSQKQGHIVLTEECLWKLTICTHIEKLPEYRDTAISTENPLQTRGDDDNVEIIFEPNTERETQKLHPVPTAPPGKMIPYILRNTKATTSCRDYVTLAIRNKSLRILDKKPIWRDAHTASEETTSTHCDLSKLDNLVSDSLPKLRHSSISASKA